MMKRASFHISLLLFAGLIIVAFSVVNSAQQIRTPRQVPPPINPDFSKMEVQTLKVQGNVYLLAGAGGNIAVQAGDEGVVVIDTGYEKMGEKVLAAIKKISTKPIRTVVNTTLADDHTGANALITKSGFRNQAGPGIGGRTNEAFLMGHSELLRLMTEVGEAKIPVDRWPPKTYPGRGTDFSSNDEPVMLIHVPNAVTAGDTMVFFRKSDVVVTGEIFNETSFPFIDLEHGGSINGILEGLNQVLEITVPKHLQEGGTMVIPGHGRIGDEHDVLEYRDMCTIIRDRVQNAINKKMTLQQVKAAKPSFTYEYEPRFGNNPAWTPDMFVEAIYKSLTAPK
jgi:glyoxylase-like metal-dependent hydrolase (beta-lactamase superfamily II)